MKIRITAWLFLLWPLWALQSCWKDDAICPAEVAGDPVAISLQLQGMSLANTPVTDKTVSRVRILAFNRNDPERSVLNLFSDSPSLPLVFGVKPGIYDFYFLVNEPEDRKAELDKLVTARQLNDLRVHTANLVAANGLYVMCAVQRNVTVETDYSRPQANGRFPATVTYTDTGGTTHVKEQTLSVTSHRLASKVNIRLVEKKSLASTLPYADVEEVKITGLPASVPMLGDMLSDQPARSEITPEQATIAAYPADGTTYEGYTAIIPSYRIHSPTNALLAARLYVKLRNDASPRTMHLGDRIGQDAGNSPDYNLYRNRIYHVTGQVIGRLDLHIAVTDWDTQQIAPELGIEWNGGDAIFLSTRSPLGLRRSGLLKADDWTLSRIKLEIIDAVFPDAPRVQAELVKNYEPMRDKSDPDYDGYVDHLKNYDLSDLVLTQVGDSVGDVSTTVGDNRKVTLRIRHSSLPGGYKDVTVYLNRTLWKDNVVFTDRFVGAEHTYDTSPDNWYTLNTGNSMGIYGFDGHCPAGYRHLRFDDEWDKWGESNPAFETWETRRRNITLGELGFKDKATGNTLYFVMEGIRITGIGGTYRVIQDGNSTDLGGPGNKPLHGVGIYVNGCTLTDPTPGHHGYQRGAEFKVFWWGFHHYYIQGDVPGLNSDVPNWYYLNRAYKIRCVRNKSEFN